MFARALVEFIGTFIFLSVILSKGEAIPIAVALAAVIFFGGGDYNPAVTVTSAVAGNVGIVQALLYIVAQVVAGLSAYGFNKYVLNK
ncbi:major intrinsic protein [Fadolivirus algeromassiliense]|jgi:glycerol uptake facilitator-like aquaporin|uniref:Major intrinsic protein n=1 Tax=Fadolivirus FV1/VV64 TaxID=3070911 RepID=A0A7D3V7X3_9VIRU|nr:major intrinsic protein [Fadolivirus algeromassiliense]QKF94636.1 major intrinsic protein [Fadolivirus FV1/VV64]